MKNAKLTRRQLLNRTTSFAAIAAAGSSLVAPISLLAQASNLRIREVSAYPIYINQRSDGLLEAPSFDGDNDPRRWRYGGPFEQLPSAIIAIIKTNEGITGFGMGAGGSAAVEIIDGHLKHLLMNTNPLNVEQLWDQMYTSGIFYGRRGVFTMALSAVDNALWDIAGQYAEMPVHELIGGADRDRIEIYQTNGDFLEAQSRGVKNFKRTTYGGPRAPQSAMDSFINSVLEARDRLGPDVRIMTDCVSRDGTVEWAIPFCERLRDANLYFMEELLSPDDVFGYAELVDRIGGRGEGWTRIACGEHEYTEHGFRVLVGLGSAEILQPDITWCGGTTAGRRIAMLVEAANLELIPHRGASSWGFPIALTSPSCTMAESFPEGSAILDAMSCQVENGYVVAPSAAGFGHSLSEEMVLDFQLSLRQ
ncbi:MAG: mandelate racemase/muconate lactonizing enzyme family protein [Gammaproteobacteria bacterium]|nr:mandelate racemase/muconate lactonizing enzyme family protein [Gammaproteobacteria bacterium]MDD9895859.1 mandelate racemase/muconate lactonizing enzyme family protein [Gammaproteobacteria bacterium]MDD9958794.1 mandelate racemase/muconate lactonizing enzyme family protein [Gammaproteobacteria bacterium]